MERSIGLTGVGNARELGGIVIGDSKVRSGFLIRTGSLAGAVPEDLKRLSDVYKVASIADMRMKFERLGSPDPVVEGAVNHELAVFEPEDFPGMDESMLYSDGQPVDRKTMVMLGIKNGFINNRMYVSFLMSDRGRKAYADFFKILFGLPEGRSVLWHCTDGKDRTGLGAMLILSALGADRDTIMEDYLLTNEYNASAVEKVHSYADTLDMPEEMRRMLVFAGGAVYEDFMENAFDGIDKNYGSTDGYLREVCGVGEEEKRLLKERFLQ